MTNISTLTNPLSLTIEGLLVQIKRICTAQDISFFIAGATAREILLHHVHGRRVGRRTRDIDIAVFVDGWQRFDELKNAFLAQDAQVVRNNAHRIVVAGIEVDIIPFGAIAEDNQIAWPPDRKIIMYVDGFDEAFRHTVQVRLDNGETLPFCSLAGLALLKLFAWRDRRFGNAKDAVDFYNIVREYGAIEDDRIYEPPVEGERLGWDPVRMGAALLGYDVATMYQEGSPAELTFLDKECLIDAIVRQSVADNSVEIEQLINAFWSSVVTAVEES
ncbi:hypothetical protein SOASR030_35170 [Leminorella grimontii]|uniref:Nucleotidyltransferase n=1 Tax=Leminorella grimontii TaxID=82981 RepID=A0AAV5N5K3_9GAMM|nr:nucleotidyl transferase AbiEii/AbiGii toxin family protein [Leminorella grimontii]KFC94429.1 hypothetical protein GLGR_2776 [Leminorella grimontii ATCC 33999 = DSM 5078]GKX57405.1 hypothetical protein SOASR030_35170 [Leminorella grimontii]VFS54642.1 Uncharacterized protein conserved in bacteria [Leminorella grimontii]